MWQYLTDSYNWSGPEGIWARIVQHIWYTFAALGLSAAIALPVGLRIGHTRRGAFLAINLGNAARALPSLGLLMLAVLLTNQIGFLPVLIALVALGIPPILASTYAGLSGVDPDTIDAARGMGMTGREILTKVEIPIALPLIISGVRGATLQIVSTAYRRARLARRARPLCGRRAEASRLPADVLRRPAGGTARHPARRSVRSRRPYRRLRRSQGRLKLSDVPDQL